MGIARLRPYGGVKKPGEKMGITCTRPCPDGRVINNNQFMTYN